MVSRAQIAIWSGVVLFFKGILILFILGTLEWPGEPEPCIAEGNCFCEVIHESAFFAQQMNTYSNLAYIIIGFAILITLVKDNKVDKINPMVTSTAYSILYGNICIFIGLGSMYFHGSMRLWGGIVDVVAMMCFITFLVLYTNVRIFGLRWSQFFVIYFVINIVCVLLLIRWFVIMWFPLFVVFAGIFVLQELLLLYKGSIWNLLIHKFSISNIPFREKRWFWVGIGCFLFGYLIWNLWTDSSSLCDSNSWFQGHAVWHFFTALTTWFFFKYLRSEKNPSSIHLK